jgi:hypothetical protein
MISPLTNVLIKIFTGGFYRAHSGMLVFLFGTLISYCFFINTLGSVPIWAFAKWNLVITLSLVSNPFILLVYFVVCFGYALKSLQFTAAQLSQRNNEFLYYSSSSLNKFQQFICWFIVQFNIMLPLWIYAIFAALIGINYGYYLAPACLLTYLFILTSAITLVYLRIVNSMIDVNRNSKLMSLLKSWKKPFFLLYTFCVFNKLKLTYIITKIFSWIFILGMVSLFSTQTNDIIIPGIVMLVLVTTHSILIYNDYKFTETYLYFSHNFPYAKIKLFVGFSANYLLLMLPELVWFSTKYALPCVVGLVCLGLSILLLFRSLLYWFGLDMKRFLFAVFLLFNLFFLALIYRLVWYLPIVNILLAYLLFIKNYSNQTFKD